MGILGISLFQGGSRASDPDIELTKDQLMIKTINESIRPLIESCQNPGISRTQLMLSKFISRDYFLPTPPVAVEEILGDQNPENFSKVVDIVSSAGHRFFGKTEAQKKEIVEEARLEILKVLELEESEIEIEGEDEGRISDSKSFVKDQLMIKTINELIRPLIEDLQEILNSKALNSTIFFKDEDPAESRIRTMISHYIPRNPFSTSYEEGQALTACEDFFKDNGVKKSTCDEVMRIASDAARNFSEKTEAEKKEIVEQIKQEVLTELGFKQSEIEIDDFVMVGGKTEE